MRCVILGGAGFLGRHVGHAIARNGHEVWSVDRIPLSAGGEAPWAAGEVIADFGDVGAWLSECRGTVDVVIHLASTTVPASANQDPVYDAQTNLVGTLRLLQGLRALPNRPLLLFASSGGAVYGRPQVVPLAEDHPTLPLGVYGATKLLIEHHLRIEEHVHGLSYRVLRLSNPYGPWQRPQGSQGVIAVFAYKALLGQPLDVWGDGSVVRDYVHASDIGQAFVSAMRHEGSERTFNIGGGKGRSLNEIIAVLEHNLGRRLERRNLPARPFDPPVNVLDVSRAAQVLGWSPVVPFGDGMAQTLQWLRAEVP